MPNTNYLPANINAAMFAGKYQNGNSPTYQRLINLIEQLIAALPINLQENK